MLSRTLLYLLFLVAASPAAATGLTPFTATYEAVKFDLVLGEIHVKLEQQSNKFIYTKNSSTKGLAALFRNEQVMEQSSLAPTANGFRVLDYVYRLNKGDKSREDSFRFESGRKVSGIYKNNPFSLKAPEGTLDRSSIELALMQDISAGNNNPSYSVIEKDRLKTYNFKPTGVQKVQTPAGEFECHDYHVVRQSGKRSTTLCLAPALNNLPVKITHEEKGTEFYMLLKSHSSP